MWAPNATHAVGGKSVRAPHPKTPPKYEHDERTLGEPEEKLAQRAQVTRGYTEGPGAFQRPFSTNNKKSATDKSAAQQEVDMTPKVASNVPKYKISDNSVSNNNNNYNNNNYNKDGNAGEFREKELYPPPQFDLKEIDASAEEPLVELLERERRAWREERMALVNCIHMQQVELNQRSIAAHDRATEIAKELAKTIELFDSRLYAVENSSRAQADASNTILKSLSDLTSKISQNLTSKSP